MNELTLRDLMNLASSDVPEAEERLEKMYEWYFDKQMAVAKLYLGAAGSILAAIVVGVLQDKIDTSLWSLGGLIVLAAITASYGLLLFSRLRRIHGAFIDSLVLYRTFAEVSDFLELSRRFRRLA